MASGTKLFLQAVNSDITIDAYSYQAVSFAGTSQGQASGSTFQTLVTNTTTNPGTPIQMTNVAGGSVVCFITPPIAAAQTIANATLLINTRGLVDNAAANAAIVAKMTKFSGGSETTGPFTNNQTNLAALSTTDNIEGTTLGTAWSPTVTSTAFARGDRAVIRLYITNSNAATMASGHTVTCSFDGEKAASAGDTWIQFGNETMLFEYADAYGAMFAAPSTFTTGNADAYGVGYAATLSSNYIMRGKDTTNTYVFWQAPIVDTTGAYFTGGNTPLTNIVLDKIIRS